ncbi:hypothetical protein Salat_0330600 [Sesamum alatum]|uniref:Uncharacterized protein n=1 Tax=Sesamum alatum TaxID=300844 RepID=A0AAE1Z179_9LAMI|nr:hypothetical protein Salat_0330600 [Sesamum alatum]
MDLTKNAIFNLWSKSRRFSRAFPLNYSSQSSSHEQPRELFRTGEEGESHKDNESVGDVGNRTHQLTDKMIESIQNRMEGTGGMEEMKGKDSDRITNKSESIMEGPDDADLKKKLEKEPGGKPVDEDKGLDVNWRSIDETKPSSG